MEEELTVNKRKVWEARLRSTARRRGLEFSRSRRRDPQAFDYGKYILRDSSGQVLAMGSLQEIEALLEPERASGAAITGRMIDGKVEDDVLWAGTLDIPHDTIKVRILGNRIIMEAGEQTTKMICDRLITLSVGEDVSDPERHHTRDLMSKAVRAFFAHLYKQID
jgi:hypothetical protein